MAQSLNKHQIFVRWTRKFNHTHADSSLVNASFQYRVGPPNEKTKISEKVHTHEPLSRIFRVSYAWPSFFSQT